MRSLQLYQSFDIASAPRLNSLITFFRQKRAPPPAAPQKKLLLAAFAAQRRGGLDQQAKNDRAIIASQLDKIGLGDQPTQLDQLARPLAALHLPCPRVMPRPLRLETVARLRRPPVRRP